MAPLENTNILFCCFNSSDDNNNQIEAPKTVPGRFVRFDESLNLTYTDKLSEEERKALWFRSRDYAAFKSDAKAILREVKKQIVRNSAITASLHYNNHGEQNNNDPELLCVRGLEKFLQKRRNNNDIHPIAKRRQYISKSIIEVQTRQKSENIHDPEGLAAMYASMCLIDQQTAQHRATQDEIIARRIILNLIDTDDPPYSITNQQQQQQQPIVHCSSLPTKPVISTNQLLFHTPSPSSCGSSSHVWNTSSRNSTIMYKRHVQTTNNKRAM